VGALLPVSLTALVIDTIAITKSSHDITFLSGAFSITRMCEVYPLGKWKTNDVTSLNIFVGGVGSVELIP
jgi:hypothetical protein